MLTVFGAALLLNTEAVFITYFFFSFVTFRCNYDKLMITYNFIIAPGTYDVDSARLDHTPAYTFGMKRKELIRNDTPAPGAYQPEKAMLDRTPAAYTFGGKHTIAKPSTNPAPGAYSPEKLALDNAPAYTFGIRTEVKMESHSPGTFW